MKGAQRLMSLARRKGSTTATLTAGTQTGAIPSRARRASVPVKASYIKGGTTLTKGGTLPKESKVKSRNLKATGIKTGGPRFNKSTAGRTASKSNRTGTDAAHKGLFRSVGSIFSSKARAARARAKK